MGNYFKMLDGFSLRTLDLSYNRIFSLKARIFVVRKMIHFFENKWSVEDKISLLKIAVNNMVSFELVKLFVFNNIFNI